MLILPATNVNFQALAENIAADFFAKGTSLCAGIVKTAKEHSFTPEEVRRLVEKTNTAASIHLLKTAEDKKRSFTLAQPELVLRETHPAAEQVEKTAAYHGLPIHKKLPTTLEKTAAVAAYQPQVDAMQAVFAVRKAIDEKKLEKTALELSVQDKIDYLASEFSKWRALSFTKFAADCTHCFGSTAQPVLNGLARYLNTTLEKTASEPAGIVDDRTSHMQAMRSICAGLGTLVKLGNEITELEACLDNIWTSWKRAVA